MNIQKIEFPFNSIFKEFKQARSLDNKKNLFKGLLESIVKFHVSLHVSWILREKREDIPLNLRVQLVQMFQKPPSLGFCHSISREINRIILKDCDKQSVWFEFASFFELRDNEMSNLIRIRNSDAHSNNLIDKAELSKIEIDIGLVIQNPLFFHSSLIVSNINLLKNTSVFFPNGIENLNLSIVLIKPSKTLDELNYDFSGNELCLLPFTVSDVSEQDGMSMVKLMFWSHKSGNKGVYSSYLSFNYPQVVIPNIKEFSGFPYEDWKRTSNPIYLNYLKCRANVLEVFLFNESIQIDEWFEEFLVARRLEQDVKLAEYEKISLVDFFRGLKIKLEKTENKEKLGLYHMKIVDLAFKDRQNWYKYSEDVLDIIIDSCVFLYGNNVVLKNKKSYNEYFRLTLLIMSDFIYKLKMDRDSNLVIRLIFKNLIKVLGGEDSYSKKAKARNIRTFFMPVLVILSCICVYLISNLLITLIWFFGVVLFVSRFNQIKIIYDYSKDYKTSEIEFKIFKWIGLMLKGLGFNPANENNKNKGEWNEILGSALPYNKIFTKPTLLNKLFAGTGSDWEIINLRRAFLQFFFFEQLKENASISNEYKLLTKGYNEKYDKNIYSFNYLDRRDSYLKGEFKINSESQRRALCHQMNYIIYLENCLALNYKAQNNEKLEDFNFSFLIDSINIDIDSSNYNYFFGLVNVFNQNYPAAIDFFKKVNDRNIQFVAQYNLAMVYGAIGDVNEYFLTILKIKEDLDLLSDEEIKSDQLERLTLWISKFQISNEHIVNLKKGTKMHWTKNMQFVIDYTPKYLFPDSLKSFNLLYTINK